MWKITHLLTDAGITALMESNSYNFQMSIKKIIFLQRKENIIAVFAGRSGTWLHHSVFCWFLESRKNTSICDTMLLFIHICRLTVYIFFHFPAYITLLRLQEPVIIMCIYYSKIQCSFFFVNNRDKKLNNKSKLSSMSSDIVVWETNKNHRITKL